MANLTLKIFQGNSRKPDTSIVIPTSALRVASRLIPKPVAAVLAEKGIDLKQIAVLLQRAEMKGPLIQIEDNRQKNRIVIAIE